MCCVSEILQNLLLQWLWIFVWPCIWTPNDMKFWHIVALRVYFKSGNFRLKWLKGELLVNFLSRYLLSGNFSKTCVPLLQNDGFEIFFIIIQSANFNNWIRHADDAFILKFQSKGVGKVSILTSVVFLSACCIYDFIGFFWCV